MFDALRRYLGRSTPRPGKPSPRPRVVPSLECLEDRRVLSTVGGSVYHDLNANGVRDPGEPGLADQAIELYTAGGGELIDRTTTDGGGAYRFTRDPRIDTTPTTRQARVVFGAENTDQERSAGLARFDPSLGRLDSVEVLVKHNLLHQTKLESLDGRPHEVSRGLEGVMELRLPGADPLVSRFNDLRAVNLAAHDGDIDFGGDSGADLGQQVFEDSPTVTLVSGVNDLSGYVGTGELTVTSLARADTTVNGPGNLAAMIQTGNAAEVTLVYHYTPSDALRPGNYRIVQPNTPDGFTDGLETGDNVTPLPGSVGTDFIDVQLPEAGSPANHFGELRRAGVSGFAYIDRNNDGVRQPGSGESGIGRVKIRLVGTDIAGGAIDLMRQTASDGSYEFAGLLPGTYEVVKESEPASLVKGKDTAGSLGGATAFNAIRKIVLGSGARSTENNFGHTLPPPPPPQRPLRPAPAPPPLPAPPPPPPVPIIALGMPTKRGFIGNYWTAWSW